MYLFSSTLFFIIKKYLQTMLNYYQYSPIRALEQVNVAVKMVRFTIFTLIPIIQFNYHHQILIPRDGKKTQTRRGNPKPDNDPLPDPKTKNEITSPHKSDHHYQYRSPENLSNRPQRHRALGFHERTKHVEMNYYFVHKRVEPKEIQPIHIDSSLQLVDMFAKGLGAQHLRFLLDNLGICNLHNLA